MATGGLLFVYGEPGSAVTEEEFNGKDNLSHNSSKLTTNFPSLVWYDNEHAPARIALPSISSAVRYKAGDNEAPSYLALYDTTVPNIYQDEGFKSLPSKGSANEKSIISRLERLDRRLYTSIPTPQKPGFNPGAAKFLLVVGLQPKPENEEDLNKWYEEEHIKLLYEIPGCLRARRFKLVDQVELGGKADPKNRLLAHRYLALYDFDNDGFLATPEFARAVGTVWAQRILGGVDDSELRMFIVHKRF